MHTVTGATGLVGSHLVYRLLKEDKPVRVIHRENSDTSFLKQVFSYYDPEADMLFKKIEFVQADLLNVPELYQALAGTEILYHCAALVSFLPKHQRALREDNPAMTAHVVNAALEQGVKHLLYVSSVAALGRKPNQTVFDENSDWVESKNNSNYAKGKYAAELEVWRGIQEGLPAAIVNPTIILGPGHWQSGSSAIFGKLAGGFKFYTQGSNGFVDVRDVVEVLLRLRDAGISGERYVVVAENMSYKELFQKIAKALGIAVPTMEIKPWLSGIGWRLEKLRALLTGSAPLLTKETARTAQNNYFYKNEKVKNALEFNFRPLAQSIKEIAGYYLKDAG